ncbi:MAG: hypothetical protein J6B54_01935, partial [Clostridia bacterium]|nr:hypothetical protein [Clostridia bacterium]
MKVAAKVFIIIGIVFGIPAIFPIIVGTIALKKLKSAACKADIKTIGILTLIFCNIVGGILMLCLEDSDFALSAIETTKEVNNQRSVVVEKNSKNKKNIMNRIQYAYIRKIKKWMFCPACQKGKMSINKKSTMWTCEECCYQLPADEFEDNYVFWWCDECGTYLNNQECFDRNASKHICRKCGYENDTTFNNIKGICSDCGKTLPDPDATLCTDCRQERRKKWLTVGGVVVAAAAVSVAHLASQPANDSDDYTLPLDDGNHNISFPKNTDDSGNLIQPKTGVEIMKKQYHVISAKNFGYESVLDDGT